MRKLGSVYYNASFDLALCARSSALASRAMREVLLSFLCALIASHAAEWTSPAGTNSAELDLALKKLRLTPGFKAEIFAAEPLIQNPTSFAFDEQGRTYVVETHRRRTSVYDIRNHPDWLDADFSFRSVADRANFFRKVPHRACGQRSHLCSRESCTTWVVRQCSTGRDFFR